MLCCFDFFCNFDSHGLQRYSSGHIGCFGWIWLSASRTSSNVTSAVDFALCSTSDQRVFFAPHKYILDTSGLGDRISFRQLANWTKNVGKDDKQPSFLLESKEINFKWAFPLFCCSKMKESWYNNWHMPKEKKVYNVFVIDDDAFLLDMYALKFSQKNFQVTSASGTLQAL